MSEITTIQWADTTVNPIMGCGGCELFPSPTVILKNVARAMNGAEPASSTTSANLKAIYAKLVNEAIQHTQNQSPGHKNKVNTTNIWHLRDRFVAVIEEMHGPAAAHAAKEAIPTSTTCYAAKLHLNKGANIIDREGNRPGKDKPRKLHPGYAPIFEMVTRFEGRCANTAELKDLLGQSNPLTPWKGKLPRLIFVSDMGDALSRKEDFPFLESDLMKAVTSEKGKCHLWLWLTKRPKMMAQFADRIDGFPTNVCAMTTLTGPDKTSLKRLADLQKVKAHMRGLSIEPLWDRIPPSELDLSGIDWVIVGGESGSGELTRPFALEWAEELRDHCQNKGVAFFLKQLGRNPSRNGKVFRLKDQHGGEWDEWPDEALKLREFPQAFHSYRRDEMKPTKEPRPVSKAKRKRQSNAQEDLEVSPKVKAEFKRQHKIVERGMNAFWEVGNALSVIKTKNLWRAAGHKSWNEYCQSVAGMSRGHAHRLLAAAEFKENLETSPRGDVLPISPIMEAQVRPLLKLPEPEQRVEAWNEAVDRAEGEQPSAPLVKEVVWEILYPDGLPEKPESRTQQRTTLVLKLKDEITKRQSWDQVEKLLEELEKLI